MGKIKLEDIKTKDSSTSNFSTEKEVEIPVVKDKIKKEKIVNPQKNKSQFKPSKNVPVRRILVIILYISILIAAFFWGGNFFQKAKIELVVKKEKIDYSSDVFELKYDNKDYEIMINTDIYYESIGFSLSEKIASKSEGSVRLFNYYSTSGVNLSAGSFIKDDRGYPYTLKSNVTIPGFKSEDDIITPGETVAKIEAFLPGEIYNGNPIKFTIDSFEGTNKFEKVYGECNEELLGGKEGMIYSLSEEDKISLNDLMNSKIKLDLIKEAELLIPDDYLFYPKLTNFSYTIDEKITSDSPALKIPVEVTLKSTLLRKENLKKEILKKSIKDLEEGDLGFITLEGTKDLDISFVDERINIDKDIKNLKLNIKGSLLAVWLPEINDMKKELAGKEKEEIFSILKKNRGVEGAKIKIFPPWQKNIPKEDHKIEISLD